MSIKMVLENDLKEAMRSGEQVKRDSIRMVLTSLKLAEVEKGSQLDDPAIIGIIQKEIKQREETKIEAMKGNREDIIAAVTEEIKILTNYLPEQISEAELMEIVQKVITEAGAIDMKDMGKVMKAAIVLLNGKASNDQISKMVRALLNK